ncbi:MAG: hypothetical protein P8K76_14045 [Candidatus Binatia bacterium]|nr:hypothetical protein [Candidatus Binatia bacterium]
MWKSLGAIFGGLLIVSATGSPSFSGDIFQGGGPRSTDCLAVFQVPAADAIVGKRLVCTDGDPTCDSDGVVNGQCAFSVGICSNYSGGDRCDRQGLRQITVEDAEDDGSREFDPDFQALQSLADAFFEFPEELDERCMPLSTVLVPVDGPRRGGSCRTGRKTVRLRSRSIYVGGESVLDRDQLRLSCRPARGGCDEKIFFDGTFDRIQRQILDKGCAVGGCHDSESTAGGLLLETGAAYGELVGMEPGNGAARAAGLLLVAPGDPDRSFLLRKLTGSLSPGFGGRMPDDGPRIPRHLRVLVQDWIAEGALADGWLDDPAG